MSFFESELSVDGVESTLRSGWTQIVVELSGACTKPPSEGAEVSRAHPLWSIATNMIVTDVDNPRAAMWEFKRFRRRDILQL